MQVRGGMDRQMRLQLRRPVRKADRRLGIRSVPRGIQDGAGRVHPHGRPHCGRVRAVAEHVLSGQGPHGIRHRAPRVHGQGLDDVARHTVRDGRERLQGEVQMRQEHRHRGIRHLLPRMRLLLCRAHRPGPERHQAVLRRVRDALGLRDPSRQDRRPERPRSPQDRRLPSMSMLINGLFLRLSWIPSR